MIQGLLERFSIWALMIEIGFRHEVSLLTDHKREAYMMRYIQQGPLTNKLKNLQVGLGFEIVHRRSYDTEGRVWESSCTATLRAPGSYIRRLLVGEQIKDQLVHHLYAGYAGYHGPHRGVYQVYQVKSSRFRSHVSRH